MTASNLGFSLLLYLKIHIKFATYSLLCGRYPELSKPEPGLMQTQNLSQISQVSQKLLINFNSSTTF